MSSYFGVSYTQKRWPGEKAYKSGQDTPYNEWVKAYKKHEEAFFIYGNSEPDDAYHLTYMPGHNMLYASVQCRDDYNSKFISRVIVNDDKRSIKIMQATSLVLHSPLCCMQT